jgi:HK97 gp10 family phage protein
MITIQVKGVDALINSLNKKSQSMTADIQAELNDWADNVATDAKQLVASNSSNEGNLLRSISPIYGQMKVTVAVSASYGAYIEFGTRKYAAQYVGSLPKEWKDMASQSEGRTGGTFKQFIESLKEWARKKGVPENMVYPIALRILRDGIRPRPFLYPAVNKNTPKFLANIKKLFK